MRPTGLVLTKGTFVINWLDLDNKECLQSTGLVLTKGMFATNWLDLDKKGRL